MEKDFAQKLVDELERAAYNYGVTQDGVHLQLATDIKNELVRAIAGAPALAEASEDFPTVRDHFAMSALQGLMGTPQFANGEVSAKFVYDYADAMMAERARRQGGAQ